MLNEKSIFKFWLTGVLFVIGVYLVFIAATPIIMILTAAFLALLLNRPTDFLTRYLKYKSLALLLVFVIVIAVISLLFITVIPIFIDGINVFSSTLPSTLQQLRGSTEPLYNFLIDHDLQSVFFQGVDILKEQFSNFAIGFLSGFSTAAMAIVNTFLILVMIAFFVLEGPIWIDKYFKWIYLDDDKRQYHRRIFKRLYFGVTGYITASFIIACIMTILAVLGLLIIGSIMGLSSSLVWPIGLVIFVTSFIPMFGGLVGGVLAFVLIGLYNPLAALIYIIYLFVYQQIINNIAMPKIFAKYINISPLMVLISMVLGTYLGGVLGMLIAIPTAACIQIIAQEFFNWRAFRDKDTKSKIK
ncbi:MAG: AI-2E family transporter [Bifidobacteriaceae bacterium]|jgi:predicted PurR-regulated permease PerM|nr:AI-2E family transporter [Bifidobacteriaceae bacterium]